VNRDDFVKKFLLASQNDKAALVSDPDNQFTDEQFEQIFADNNGGVLRAMWSRPDLPQKWHEYAFEKAGTDRSVFFDDFVRGSKLSGAEVDRVINEYPHAINLVFSNENTRVSPEATKKALDVATQSGDNDSVVAIAHRGTLTSELVNRLKDLGKVRALGENPTLSTDEQLKLLGDSDANVRNNAARSIVIRGGNLHSSVIDKLIQGMDDGSVTPDDGSITQVHAYLAARKDLTDEQFDKIASSPEVKENPTELLWAVKSQPLHRVAKFASDSRYTAAFGDRQDLTPDLLSELLKHRDAHLVVDNNRDKLTPAMWEAVANHPSDFVRRRGAYRKNMSEADVEAGLRDPSYEVRNQYVAHAPLTPEQQNRIADKIVAGTDTRASEELVSRPDVTQDALKRLAMGKGAIGAQHVANHPGLTPEAVQWILEHAPAGTVRGLLAGQNIDKVPGHEIERQLVSGGEDIKKLILGNPQFKWTGDDLKRKVFDSARGNLRDLLLSKHEMPLDVLQRVASDINANDLGYADLSHLDPQQMAALYITARDKQPARSSYLIENMMAHEGVFENMLKILPQQYRNSFVDRAASRIRRSDKHIMTALASSDYHGKNIFLPEFHKALTPEQVYNSINQMTPEAAAIAMPSRDGPLNSTGMQNWFKAYPQARDIFNKKAAEGDEEDVLDIWGGTKYLPQTPEEMARLTSNGEIQSLPAHVREVFHEPALRAAVPKHEVDNFLSLFHNHINDIVKNNPDAPILKGYVEGAHALDGIDTTKEQRRAVYEQLPPERKKNLSHVFPQVYDTYSMDDLRRAIGDVDAYGLKKHKSAVMGAVDGPEFVRNKVLDGLKSGDMHWPTSVTSFDDDFVDSVIPKTLRDNMIENPSEYFGETTHDDEGYDFGNDRRDAFLDKIRNVSYNPIRDVKKVGVKFAERLRMARDFADSHGGSARKSDLKKAGLSPKDLGIAYLLEGGQTITSDAVQNHIDKMPSHDYAVGHTSWDGPQKHSENTKNHVFQLDMTPELRDTLSEHGVLDGFNELHKMSHRSHHPVNPNTLGWVRYTVGHDGIFIDEIQSDLGQSTVRQLKKMREEGQGDTGKINQIIDATEKAHHIVWAGKHPSEVLHHAFLQSLRDSGMASTPVHIWHAEGKKHISLDPDEEMPVHFRETYNNQPKKMGYTPAQYGDLNSQDRDSLVENYGIGDENIPTWKSTLKKSDVEELVELLAQMEEVCYAVCGETVSTTP
jgi:hypothetical protein